MKQGSKVGNSGGQLSPSDSCVHSNLRSEVGRGLDDSSLAEVGEQA